MSGKFVQTSRGRRFRRGTRISARSLNHLVEIENRRGVISQAPTQVRSGGKKTTSSTRQFKVVEVQDDYLVCASFDGVQAGSELIKVAKPWLLRASLNSRDGLSYTYTNSQQRTADNGSETETQVVVPSYVADDIIFAINSIKGSTGVSVSVKGLNSPVDWIDLNIDSRAWAKQSEE